MPFPELRAAPTTSDNTATDTHNFTLPSTVVDNDLVMVAFAIDGNQFTSFTAGWTLVKALVGSTTPVFRVYAKVGVSGDSGGTVTALTTGFTESSAAMAWSIKAGTWQGTLALDTTGLHASTGTGSDTAGDVNTDIVTPAWGSDDTLWLSIGGIDGQRTFTSYPTDYDGGTGGLANANHGAGAGGGATVVLAGRNLAATSQDPGAFDHTDGIWRGVTVAVQPAAAAGDSVPPAPPQRNRRRANRRAA